MFNKLLIKFVLLFISRDNIKLRLFSLIRHRKNQHCPLGFLLYKKKPKRTMPRKNGFSFNLKHSTLFFDMRNFAAAIFDMDGLLLDSERLALETFQTTCLKFNTGDLSELFKQCLGTNSKMGESILKNGLQGIANFEEFSLAWDGEYERVTAENPIPLKDGVEELLRYIESIKIPMAVATSTATDRAQKKLDNSGILDYFEFIMGGDQVTRSKPDPEIYLKTASRLSSKPTRCIAFEDSCNGVKAAVAAGMTVVQIPDLIQPDEALLRLKHIILPSLADVPQYEFSS